MANEGAPRSGTHDRGVLLAEGREAEVYLRPEGTVLKLWREPGASDRAEREAAVCRLLAGAGRLAPAVHQLTTVDGRPGLVLERIDAPDLLTELQRRPYRLLAAGRILGETHARMHGTSAPPELPDLHDELARRIRGAPLPAALADRALEVLSGLPRGDRLCHGDFHLGNVLGPWRRPVVIDWGSASRGDPVADVARTDLLHRIGALPADAPAWVRALSRVARRVIADRYLVVYRRRRPVDGAFERWRVVNAAARLHEQIPEERASLLGLLEGYPGEPLP